MHLISACLAFAGIYVVLANPQTRCYIKDGNAFCGEEGENARASDLEEVRQLIQRQRNSRIRGDDLDLPQGDDPRLIQGGSSRWMQTDPVAAPPARNPNDKGFQRPEKGFQRPEKGQQIPQTTSPPCMPRTTTTTTTTTTTEPPCMRPTTTESPCDAWRRQQASTHSQQTLGYRSRGFQSDQPDFSSMPCPRHIENRMMADQPLRGDSAVTNAPYVQVPQRAIQLTSHGIPSIMSSALPSQFRSSSQGRLMLYHTFANSNNDRTSRNSNSASSKNSQRTQSSSPHQISSDMNDYYDS